MLFVDEDSAIANGMTHEGRLYGVKVWYCNDASDKDVFYAVPFFILSVVWLMLIDALLEFMCLVTGNSVTIEPEMVRALQKQSLT
jgi:hypothetical protein